MEDKILSTGNMTRFYRETATRENADQPTVRMLDLWHSLCDDVLKYSIEVMVANRREHPQLKGYEGELNTAFPDIIDGQLKLVLWLDSLNNVSSVIITHELGHRVLQFQGYKGVLYTPRKHNNIEILLNSLSSHPPLYVLQRSLGHDPQNEIDSRTQNDIMLFSRDKEPGRQNWTQNALLISDDLFNCSPEYEKKLKHVIKNKHPNTSKLVSKVFPLMQSYNLLKPDSNLKFHKRVIQELQLGSDWKEADDVAEYRTLLKRQVKTDLP